MKDLVLILVRGLPGSGKSSFGRLLSELGMCCIEADDYFITNVEYRFNASKLKEAHKECQEKVKNCLFSGFSVIVSNTSTTEKEVKIYQDIANEYNAKFISLVIENRHDGVNIHNVPEEKLIQMKNRFSIKL